VSADVLSTPPAVLKSQNTAAYDDDCHDVGHDPDAAAAVVEQRLIQE
jgi:hypothetical protein